MLIGSPPPVRGKVDLLPKPNLVGGITPACAGKRVSCAASAISRRDHPRLCGEKKLDPNLKRLLYGSPPPVRGKVLESRSHPGFPGITPACAGKSVLGLRRNMSVEDHPRLCGEKHAVDDIHKLAPGSPPPVRGKEVLDRIKEILNRITPACAGKRWLWRARSPIQQDHPRLCGEKRYGQNSKRAKEGSPPPVRGKVSPFCQCVSFTRITPACAGKSEWQLYCGYVGEDHPRLCGEKWPRFEKIKGGFGSPPPVRGKAAPAPAEQRRERITPACAGKSEWKKKILYARQDHPRLCGEKRHRA